MPFSNYIPSSRISQAGVCTSTTRPASPYTGQVIYETDTSLLRIWTGSAWGSPKFDNPLGVVSGGTTRNLPFAMAVGALYGGAVATTVTYPSGRFTDLGLPILYNADSTIHPQLTALSSTGFTYQNSSGANATLYWIAIQMTSGSYAG